MMEKSNATEDSVPGLYSYGSFQVLILLIHTFNLIALLVCSRLMYNGVQIAHPVYALIFQEVWVLIALDVACAAAFKIIVKYGGEEEGRVAFLLLFYFASAQVGLQFHQMTWLGVTCIRYYLLLGNKHLVDMDQLRKRSLLAMWCVTLPFLVACQAPWIMLLIIGGQSLSSGWVVRLIAIGVTSLLNNIPDFISIVLYILMKRRLNKVENGSNDFQPIEEEEDSYGGIWVGGHGDHPDVGGTTTPPPTPNPEHNSPADKSEVPASILRILRLHVSWSMVDIVISFLCSMLLPHVSGIVLGYLFYSLGCFWIPIAVIRGNVRQLDGVCGRWSFRSWMCWRRVDNDD